MGRRRYIFSTPLDQRQGCAHSKVSAKIGSRKRKTITPPKPQPVQIKWYDGYHLILPSTSSTKLNKKTNISTAWTMSLLTGQLASSGVSKMAEVGTCQQSTSLFTNVGLWYLLACRLLALWRCRIARRGPWTPLQKDRKEWEDESCTAPYRGHQANCDRQWCIVCRPTHGSKWLFMADDWRASSE